MKCISAKVLLPALLFMLLVMAVSMLSFHENDHDRAATENQNDKLENILVEKDVPHTLKLKEKTEKPAVVEVQREYILTKRDLFYDKEPVQEKENPPLVTANYTRGKEEPIPAKTNSQVNETTAKKETNEAVSSSIEPISQVNNNVNVDPTLNQYVLDVIHTYPINESQYPYC